MRLRSPVTLKGLMRQEQLSTRALANKAQCSNSMVDHLLHGRRDCCRRSLAVAICAALHVPLLVLFAPADDEAVGT